MKPRSTYRDRTREAMRANAAFEATQKQARIDRMLKVAKNDRDLSVYALCQRFRLGPTMVHELLSKHGLGRTQEASK